MQQPAALLLCCCSAAAALLLRGAGSMAGLFQPQGCVVLLPSIVALLWCAVLCCAVVSSCHSLSLWPGLTLWRAAPILCGYLVDTAARHVEGRQVLELGAGLGLCG